MFIKKVQERFYQNAKTPHDLPWHREEPNKLLPKMISKRATPGRALDLGCGSGVFSVYMAKHGYEVTAVDFMTRALEMTNDRAKQEGIKIKTTQADLLNWKGDGTFDVILDFGCLHSLIGGDVDRYKTQITSWLSADGDYLLEHWGRRNFMDWRPIGPKRRAKENLIEIFSPELELVDSYEDLMTDVPFPFGPTVQGLCMWFKRRS